MPHTIYDNFVLENKIEDMLSTKLNLNNYLTTDYSLSENAGNIKKIHTYTASGSVEDLAMGSGNTSSVDVSFTEKEYVVKTTQGKFAYYDEQEAADPMVVETGLKGLTDKMANDFTTKAITEMEKTTQSFTITDWSFDDFADAIAVYPYEEEEGLFCLINPAQKATIRKALQDDLKYSEGMARTGYIGSVCGVPVIVSKAVPAGEAFLGDAKAVTAFIKKGVEIEQERNADTRQNKVFARKVAVVALTDATRMIKMGTPIGSAAVTYANNTFSCISGVAGAVASLYDGTTLIDSVTCSTAGTAATISHAGVSGKTYTVVFRKDGYMATTKTVKVS